MTNQILSEIKFHLTSGKDSNIVAICSANYKNELFIGSIAIRRENDGKLKCLFPNKKIGNSKISIYYPLNKDIQERISNLIITKYQNLLNDSKGDL